MVDATVAFAIEKLNDFLTKEVNTRIGVKDGVRWLKDELGYLQSSLRYAESMLEEELIPVWINNIRDVANDAVIILDRFSVFEEEHAHSKQGFLDLMWRSICMCKKEANLYDIGKEIESLKGRVVEMKNRRQEYGITNILATPMVKQKKRTLLRATSFENQVDVVGFEDDVKILLAELVREDPYLKVISIHGMGGLGKTTVASKLYHSTELSHFKSRAWVCVSHEYNIKDILKTIIKSLMGHGMDLSNMDEVDLLQHLRKLLLDRDRFLVVIDDIWDIEAWGKIKKAFPDKKNGSRAIITTRIKKVAQRVDDGCFVHELRFLREDESWQLFARRANPTQNLEKLGKEMLSKCRGLPLAIVVLSGLLLHKKSYEEWSEVKDHIWRQLKGDSIEIQDILGLSYDDLSFQMRQCFLYLARFPEDYSFGVDKLKLLWIAEEFILEADEGDGMVMEDVAEDYLNELINRNMIQIARLSLNGQAIECRVHDLVRDLALEKAMKEKLLGIFDSRKHHPSPTRLLHGQPRHAIYNGIGEYLKLVGSSPDDLKLRSLALTYGNSILKLEEIKLMYNRFKYIKVLDLTNVLDSDGIPEEIGDLALLNFLGLVGGHSFSKPLVIPPAIGKLKRLQTLCGSVCSRYKFPREICDLEQLRHLKFRPYTERLAEGNMKIGGHQTKLQTLETIWYEDWIQIDTRNFTNLRTLVIASKSEEENADTLDSIALLTSLQSFSLEYHVGVIPTIKPLSSCKRLKKVSLMGMIRDPSELSFLPDSVTYLGLHSSRFTQDPMPTLGSFPNLIGLDLIMVYMGNKMECNHNAFSNLQVLCLKFFPNLEEWQVEDGALPSLKGFEIVGCQKLKVVSQRVKCLPSKPNIFY